MVSDPSGGLAGWPTSVRELSCNARDLGVFIKKLFYKTGANATQLHVCLIASIIVRSRPVPAAGRQWVLVFSHLLTGLLPWGNSTLASSGPRAACVGDGAGAGAGAGAAAAAAALAAQS